MKVWDDETTPRGAAVETIETTASPQAAHRPATWGHHLVLDISGCRIDVATDPAAIRLFVRELVRAIEMKAHGEPLVEHFAEHEPELAGWTLIQLIETSSITAHFVDMTGDCFLDVFSCREFDADVALGVVRQHLSPREVSARMLVRRA